MALSTTAEGPTRTSDFAELVEAHQAMVFSLAYHFLHDRTAAEEIAQDVFLELHLHLNELESSEHRISWLRRVALNRCIDEGRRRKRHREAQIEELPEPIAPAAKVDQWTHERLQWPALDWNGEPGEIGQYRGVTGCNETHLAGSDGALRGVYALNLIVPDVEACHFGALNDIHPKVARCLCIAPGHPVMFGDAATRLVGGSMNRIPDIFADIDDGHQLLHFCWSEPLTINAIEGIRIEIPAYRSHITN